MHERLSGLSRTCSLQFNVYYNYHLRVRGCYIPSRKWLSTTTGILTISKHPPRPHRPLSNKLREFRAQQVRYRSSSYHSAESHRVNTDIAERSLDQLRKSLHQKQRQWLASPSRARLRHILMLNREVCGNVHKVVAIGLGSFSTTYFVPWTQDLDARLFQLACLLDLAKLVPALAQKHFDSEEGKGRNVKALPIVAQDPMFSDTDQMLLSRLGVKVVEHPQIWTEIDHGTLAYGISFPYLSIEPSFFYGQQNASSTNSVSGPAGSKTAASKGPSLIIYNDIKERPWPAPGPMGLFQWLFYSFGWYLRCSREDRKRYLAMQEYEDHVLANYKAKRLPTSVRIGSKGYGSDPEDPKGLAETFPDSMIYIKAKSK